MRLALHTGAFVVDPVAKNLERAEVRTTNPQKLVGFVTRQTYRCKGGFGLTIKAFAYLANGTDTTYVAAVSLNGGEVTALSEADAYGVVLGELSTYASKHGGVQ